MQNLSDSAPAALSFPVPFPMTTESPLSKLVEHCNKFGNVDNKMKLVEPVKLDALPLPADMNAYSPYLSTPNWWEHANWGLYPSVTSAASDTYHNYLAASSSFGLLSSSAAAAAAVTQSALSNLNLAHNQQATTTAKSLVGKALKSTSSSVTSSTSTSSSSGVSTTSSSTASSSAAGGKYQAARTTANKCDCPNCKEADKFGLNRLDARKIGVHNCHVAGCGKVYNKSSHLKAHLRWHSTERATRRRND